MAPLQMLLSTATNEDKHKSFNNNSGEVMVKSKNKLNFPLISLSFFSDCVKFNLKKYIYILFIFYIIHLYIDKYMTCYFNLK